MKRIYAVIALMLCVGCAWGQRPCASGAQPTNTTDYASWMTWKDAVRAETWAVPKALPKCAKYQHFVEGGRCFDDPYATLPNPFGMWCATGGPAHCVEDMHKVTEREWQELITRLAKLEKRQQIDGWPK